MLPITFVTNFVCFVSADNGMIPDDDDPTTCTPTFGEGYDSGTYGCCGGRYWFCDGQKNTLRIINYWLEGLNVVTLMGILVVYISDWKQEMKRSICLYLSNLVQIKSSKRCRLFGMRAVFCDFTYCGMIEEVPA